jgi:hypothetical protein
MVMMCIDVRGRVSSVKIVRTSVAIGSDLTRALRTWRYQPFLQNGAAAPVCFVLSLRVVFKRPD